MIFREEDVGGRERVTTDEERVARGAEQRSGCVSKASRPDLIPCRLLKGLAEEIAPILAEIFRQSLRDGVIPSIWKNADVAPVFKKGGRDTAENYRPISLTCVYCKILEHIISSHIRHHIWINMAFCHLINMALGS